MGGCEASVNPTKPPLNQIGLPSYLGFCGNSVVTVVARCGSEKSLTTRFSTELVEKAQRLVVLRGRGSLLCSQRLSSGCKVVSKRRRCDWDGVGVGF
ncbi:hypothetical protein L484_022408 [Morus notabilis]|uniref:Uncharacterized protein n=1 Tax=Morus notabilis TaxID=981085 RepID=W9RFB5_9ROSA|nr:hypothetical protein L484_022408 [Morus notabilis]